MGRVPVALNNDRCLPQPHKSFPQLGSRSPRPWPDRLGHPLAVARDDHPVLLVETFVAQELFGGTVPWANGWWQTGR